MHQMPAIMFTRAAASSADTLMVSAVLDEDNDEAILHEPVDPRGQDAGQADTGANRAVDGNKLFWVSEVETGSASHFWSCCHAAAGDSGKARCGAAHFGGLT